MQSSNPRRLWREPSSTRAAFGLAVLAFGLSACSMTQLAIDTQSEVMELAAPEIEEQTDYAFAGSAIPANLLQLDGLLRVSPDNERLLFLAARSWGAYAYGFVEDEMAEAERRGDIAASDAARARARDMYLKAKGYALRLLFAMEPDLKDALQRDPDALRSFVEANFTDASDAPALFWAGYSWGSAINVSRDDPTLLADLPFPAVLVERSVALDEGYYHAAGHVFLGVFNSSLGESIGGNPEKGKKHFERALELTQRQATIVQANYAESYAVQVQDKKLFLSLLQETIDAPVARSPLALANAVARRRAQRLLAQADGLILEPLPALPEPGPEATPEPAPTAPAVPPAAAAPSASPAAAPPAQPAGAVPAASAPKVPPSAPAPVSNPKN